MRIFVGVTDFDWYQFLSSKPKLDEVNFWQPSATGQFRALNPGEPFLFKLHSPRNFIVGGGFFAHYSELPVSLAWGAFEEKNGAHSLGEMRRRIERYRRFVPTIEDYKIGCILLTQPFFFLQDDWLSVPKNWSSNIVRGKRYNTDEPIGAGLWEKIMLRLQAIKPDMNSFVGIAEKSVRYGSPITIIPRLGQGSFRIIVTDVYDRRCAVTQERTLPTLEASHIKPYSESGPHHVNNGVLLRADIHKLLDAGYVTIAPDYHLEVSRKIKTDFDNGKNYYSMHGMQLRVPKREDLRPSSEFITWHNENVFRG
jgi:putative restriction endonuclease